jgi:hypothetical protein
VSTRYYLVTFDLKNSKGREAEYKRADDALVLRYGPQNYWRIVKQCRIIRTSQDARHIRDSLHQRLGGNCNILVVRLRRGYAFTLMDPQDRAKARDCLQNIPSQPQPR